MGRLHCRRLDSIETKYHQHGKRVEIRGMNDASQAFHGRLAGNLGSVTDLTDLRPAPTRHRVNGRSGEAGS